MAKRMRLDNVAFRQAGHPTEEHYVVPPAKFDGMEARGVKIVSLDAFFDIKTAKQPYARPIFNNYAIFSGISDTSGDFSGNKKKNKDQKRFRAARRAMKEAEND